MSMSFFTDELGYMNSNSVLLKTTETAAVGRRNQHRGAVVEEAISVGERDRDGGHGGKWKPGSLV